MKDFDPAPLRKLLNEEIGGYEWALARSFPDAPFIGRADVKIEVPMIIKGD